MSRKTIIFGNGLSMALDHVHYNLANAIDYIWEHEEILSDDDRRYILQCLPSAEDRPPQGEDELDTLHLAVTACGFLDGLSGDDVEWLSPQGQHFPRTIETFVHRVATRLHDYFGELPTEFTEPLCDFLKETKSHIATLNYDRLLYDALCENDILKGYSGCLVDGMWDQGFHQDNLERKFGRDFGYFLHLHGSPLFYGQNPPRKMSRDRLTLDCDHIGEHIVLTHVRHKPSVIAASQVLSAYWEYLELALGESDEIIVFGYGGMDVHLNRLLKRHATHIPIRVIEWDQSTDDEFGSGERARQRFWERRLGDKVELVQVPNVLEFHDW